MNVFRIVSVLSFPMLSGLSTGVLLYLITNGVLLMLQSLVLRNTALRRWLGILPRPPPPAPVISPSLSASSPILSPGSRAATGATGVPVEENLNPSFKDTAIAIRQYFRDQQTNAIKAAEEQAARKRRESVEQRDLTQRWQHTKR